MIIDQITPHFPKDNKEVNAHVKCLQVIPAAATVVDPVHDQESEDRGHEDDHRHSPCGDSASIITPPEKHNKGHERDNHDLRDIIHSRDARSRIENQCRDQEHDEQEQRNERDYDYYAPYYD
jgi:hypothetical protein